MPRRLPKRIQKIRGEEELEKRIVHKSKANAEEQTTKVETKEEPRLSQACIYFLMFVLFGR